MSGNNGHTNAVTEEALYKAHCRNGTYVTERNSLIREAEALADERVPSTASMRAKYEWDKVFLLTMDQLYDERFRRRHTWGSNG